MDVRDGYQIKTESGVYKTVVREFDDTRGLWEEVVYKTVDGIDYVESRTPSYDGGVPRPTSTPNTGKDVPPKPKKVNKPVLEMLKPTKPVPFIATTSKVKGSVNAPGPMPEIASAPLLDDTAVQSQSRYLYSYGIKNFSVKHQTYAERGVFVSKPMEIEGNVIEVSMLTTEEHPVFDDLSGKATDRMTSIEYYVAYEENPSLNDWHPVLPEGQTEVKSERLFFTNATAKLRFHSKLGVDDKTNVYKNGMKMDKAKWCLVERGASVQLLEQRDLTAIYTIDYIPDPVFYNPWVLNVKEQGAKRVRQIDTFEQGTAYNKTVTLSKYPYVDYEYMNKVSGYNANTNDYRPFEVYLRNGDIAIGDGKNVNTVFPKAGATADTPFTENKTDYKEGKDVKLAPYSIKPGEKYAGFEYKQERSKLIFSETFNRANIFTNQEIAHGNAEIEVQYEYLVTNFRIKIIVRKNTGNNTIVSPRVNDYQVKFKIMK